MSLSNEFITRETRRFQRSAQQRELSWLRQPGKSRGGISLERKVYVRRIEKDRFQSGFESNPGAIHSRIIELHAVADMTSTDGIPRTPASEVLEIIRNSDAFCFDVDSTFCMDESIDELAEYLGVGEKVKELTSQAMGGSMLFQDALAARLNVMNPSRQSVEKFLQDHPHVLSEGIPQLLNRLKGDGKHVFLVSGGFRQIIHPLAESLGIPLSNVFANNLLFHEDGSYAGFDPAEFTSRSGGKKEAVMHIKEAWDLQTVIMVGDGATDAEAKAPMGADVFIGYGGTVFRENVAIQSDWYVMEIAEILEQL